jgi:2'-5' RNA ligase
LLYRPASQRDFLYMDMYYMAIVLPEELNKEVLKYKQYMLDQYQCRVGLKSPAHTTIIPPYWMERSKESALLQELENVCKELAVFPITTKNFSAFKPRTIFIDVEVNETLRTAKKRIDRFFQEHKDYGAKIETRPFHPHITIATRDLYKKAFAEAWSYFEHKTFSATFTASGLSVLRHNKVNWEVIHTAAFSAA